MTETLTLPADVYRKLAQGAAERGMTIESLLIAVSELVATPDQPKERDRQRRQRIERLFERFRAGRLNAADREELNHLIGADYQEANARADKVINAKKSRTANGTANSGKRSRK